MRHSQEIVFGQNANQTYHTFRYTDALALDRDAVIEAIRADLDMHLPLPVPPPNNAPFRGTVTVQGIALRYHAYPVSEASVNAGSITSP
jgi:hypothetical protein